MNTITLQIPLPKDVKIAAQKTAHEMGFSSLQEFIRVVLKKLADRTISIEIGEAVTLSAKAEKRYNKMIADIKTGKGWHKAENVEDLFKQLSQ